MDITISLQAVIKLNIYLYNLSHLFEQNNKHFGIDIITS